MEAANKDIGNLQGMTENAKWNRAAGSVNTVTNARAQVQAEMRQCYRCGGTSHMAKECRFAGEKCHNCGKVGHIKRACRMKAVEKEEHTKGGREKHGRRANFMHKERDDGEEVFTMYHIKACEFTMYTMSEEIVIPRAERITKELKVNGQIVTYEVDTRCGYTIMSRGAFHKLFKDR